MGATDTDKLRELTSNMKLVAATLKIPVRSSLSAMLVDFEDWFFGENYRTSINSIYKFVSDEGQWPNDFFTDVVLKFDDTNDMQTCMILGEQYQKQKYGPNTKYFRWWHEAAQRHRHAIDEFMQATAPASPPSAPASAPAEPEPVAEIIVFDTCDHARSDTNTDVDSEEDLFLLPLPECDAWVLECD